MSTAALVPIAAGSQQSHGDGRERHRPNGDDETRRRPYLSPKWLKKDTAQGPGEVPRRIPRTNT